MKKQVLLACCLVALLVITLGGVVTFAASPGPIRSVFNGKCVDVTNGDPTQYVQQWTCYDNNSNQKWERIYTPISGYGLFRNPRTGKCLAVVSSLNGSKLRLVTCNVNDSKQQWALWNRQGYAYELLNRYSNKCLDVTNWSWGNGVKLQIWTCTANSNQYWYVYGF